MGERSTLLVQNERVRLTATALNNVAVATVVTGFIAPGASFLYGLTSVPNGRAWWVIAGAWITGGLALHYATRRVLGRLVP